MIDEQKEEGVLSSGSKLEHTYVICGASVLDVGAEVFHRRLGSSSTGGITGYLNKKCLSRSQRKPGMVNVNS